MNDTLLKKVTDSIGLMQKNLECSICLDLLQDPVCTKCDHQFCNFCVLALLQSSRKSSAPCPLCKVAITKRSLTKNEQLDKIVRGVRAVMEAVEEDTGLRCSPPRGPVLFSQPDLKTKQASSESQTEARARGKGKRIKDKKKARNVRKAQPKSAVMIKVHQDENECSADSENELLVVGHTNIRSSFPNLSFDRKKGRHADFQNDTDLEREAEELLNALNVAPLTSTVVSNTSCYKDMDKMEQNESVNHSGTLPVLLQGNDHENKISAREDISSTEVPPTKILPPCGKENVSGDPGVDPYEFIPSQHTPRKIKIRDIVRKRKTMREKKCLAVSNKKSSRKVTEVSEVVVEVATSENESRLHGNCSLVDADPSSNCAPTTSKIHNSDSTETKSDAAAEALQDSQPVSSGGKIQDSQPVILNRNHGKKVFATAYRKGNKGQCKSPCIDPQERVLDWLVSKHPGSDDEHGKLSKELWDKVSQEGEMEDLHDIRGLLPPSINVLQRTNHQDSLHASVNLPMGETSRASTTPDDASEHVQILDKKGEMTSVVGTDTGPSLTCIRESPLSTNDNNATQNEVGQCEPEREKGVSNPKPGLTLTDFEHADMDELMEQGKVQPCYSREGHGHVHKGFMETAQETFQDQKREMLHISKHATSAWNGGQDMQQIPEHETANQMMTESCSTNIRNEEDVCEKVALIKSDWKVALELAQEFGTEPMHLRRQLHHNSEREMCTHGRGKLPKRSQRSTANERKSSRRNKKIPANVQHQRTLTEQEVCKNSFQTQNPEDRTKRSQKRKQKAPESSNAFLTNQQDTMKSHHVNRDEGLSGVQQVDVSELDLMSSASDLKVEDVTSPNQIVREQFQICNSAVTGFEEPVDEIIVLPSIPLYTEDVTAVDIAPKQSIEQVCGGSDTTESIELTSDECEEIGKSHDLPLHPTKQDSREDSKILETNECQFPLKQEVATRLDTEMEILNSILPSHNSQSAQMDSSTIISTCNSVVEVASDDHVCQVQLYPISADPDKEHLKTSNLNADYCFQTDIARDPTKPSSSLETRRQGSFPLSSLDMCSQPSESLLNSSRRLISHPEKLIRENDSSAGDHEPVQNISDVNDKKSESRNNLEENKAVRDNAFHIEDSQKGTRMEYSSQKTHTSLTNSNNEFVCSETLENQTMTALEKISSDSPKQDVDSDVPKGSVEKVSSSLSSVICISESEDQPVRRSLRSRSKRSQDMNAFQCTGRKKEKSRGKAESDKQSMSVFSLARTRKSRRPDEDITETGMHVTEISSVSIDHRETSGSQFRVTRKRRNSLKQNILSPMAVKRQSLHTEKTDLAFAFDSPEVRNKREANPLQENFSENFMSEYVSLRSQRSICTDDDPIDSLIPPTPPCQDLSKSRSNLTTSFGKQNTGSLGDTSGSGGDTGITKSLPEKLTSTSQISSASHQQQGRGFQSKNHILEIQTVDKESSKMRLNEDIITVDMSTKQMHRRMTSPGNHSEDMGTSPVGTVCQTAVGEYVSTARELSPGAIAIKSSCDSDTVSERRGRPRKLLLSTDTSSDEDGSDTDVIQRRKQKRAKKIPALEEEEEQEGLDSDDDLIPCSFLQQSVPVPVSLEEDGGETININTTVPARGVNDYNSVSSEDSCGSQFLNQTSASSILSSQSEIMNTQQKEKAYEKIQQLEKQMVELQAALATESHDHSHKAEEEEEEGGTFDSGSKTDHFGSHKARNHGTANIAEMNKQADDQSQIKANYTERPCVMEVEEGDRAAAEGELPEPQSPSPPPALSPHSVKKLSSSIKLSESMHTVTTLVEQYRKRNTKKPKITKRTWQNDVSDDENMSDENLGNCHISPSLTSSCNSLCAQPTNMPSPRSFSREGKRKKWRILGDNTNDNFNQENCSFEETHIPQKMTSKFKKPLVDASETNELGSRGRGRHIYPDEEDSVQTSVIQTPTRQASKMPQTELIPSSPPVQVGTVMRTPQSTNTTHGSIQPLSGAGKDGRQGATSSESILSGMGRETRQMSLIASGLNRIELRQVEKLTRLIDGCRFASAFNANTTHVIVKTDASLVCERTLKYFQGIAARAWVVSFKWVSDSLEAEQPLAEESYEVRGDVVNGLDHQGPRRSRTWDGPGFLSRYDLCCIGPYSGLNKDQLVGLCEMCGACTVQHPSLFPYTSGKTAFIVVEPNLTDTPTDYQGLYRRLRVPVISREWILDSIAQYKTQPILDYLLSGAEQPITDLE